MIAKEEAGKRYGRLLVLSRSGCIGKQAAWLCRCDCGNEARISGKSMRHGDTKSCGCYQRERTAAANRRKRVKLESAPRKHLLPPKPPSAGRLDSSGFKCGDPPPWLILDLPGAA